MQNVKNMQEVTDWYRYITRLANLSTVNINSLDFEVGITSSSQRMHLPGESGVEKKFRGAQDEDLSLQTRPHLPPMKSHGLQLLNDHSI